MRVRITHTDTGIVIADGPMGWGITSFEGNYYIRRKYLRTDAFSMNYLPGICLYKFLYVWLDFRPPNGDVHKNLGWMYWLPNPLFPFIWYRVGLPGDHPKLTVKKYRALKPAAST